MLFKSLDALDWGYSRTRSALSLIRSVLVVERVINSTWNCQSSSWGYIGVAFTGTCVSMFQPPESRQSTPAGPESCDRLRTWHFVIGRDLKLVPIRIIDEDRV